MPPKYKLLYFNVTGLGEPIRYLLHYGNLQFEDYRFEYDEWLKLKPDAPFGQVPILEVDGKPIFQSTAICRYLAREIGGLTGNTSWDALQADMIVDTLTDFRLNYADYFRESSEDGKAKILQDIKTIHNPFYLPKLEKIASENGGHFVNGQTTWADVYFAAISDLMSNVVKEPILNGYPTLRCLKDNIDSIHGIKTYRDKRPQTLC